jgi:hypothetical protein
MLPALSSMIVESSAKAAEAAACELLMAWMAHDTGIWVPSFRIAWSKTIPS